MRTAYMGLRNKKVLITGSSRGIGRAIAQALAAEGARLFLTARDRDSLRDLKETLSEKGADVDFEIADLVDYDQLKGMFDGAIGFLGGIDVLVNNAGIGKKGNVVDMDVADWDRMFEVNMRAAFILSKMAASEMIKTRSGHIINIGSGASKTPIAGFAGYCATKHGLLGFSESLGLELRQHNVKVSIVLPGSTATYFGDGDPEKKIAAKPGVLRPEDIADAVLYLLKQSDIAWTSVMNVRPLDVTKGR
jgi:3-oxoacyl-[acyl-carrier protein] reductase